MSFLPSSLPGRTATTEKKEEKERKRERKNVQERTLTSAACNIPYGRSSVIFSGKSVAAALSLSLSLSIGSKLDQTADFQRKGGREGWILWTRGREKEDREDDESRGDC